MRRTLSCLAGWLASFLLFGCRDYAEPPAADSPTAGRVEAVGVEANDDDRSEELKQSREMMIQKQLIDRGIRDERVLEAMREVQRHAFVPADAADQAYADQPLPIGHGQTISQPYIVALMTELAEPAPEDRGLDVGTGSGYQAAVLAELVSEVYSIEIVPELGKQAKGRLSELGYDNVTVRIGDGYAGWPEKAPFDVIILAASPEEVPQPLVDQLAPGGRMVLPVGTAWRQNLLLITKDEEGRIERQQIAPVAFVPMTGEAQRGGDG